MDSEEFEKQKEQYLKEQKEFMEMSAETRFSKYLENKDNLYLLRLDFRDVDELDFYTKENKKEISHHYTYMYLKLYTRQIKVGKEPSNVIKITDKKREVFEEDYIRRNGFSPSSSKGKKLLNEEFKKEIGITYDKWHDDMVKNMREEIENNEIKMYGRVLNYEERLKKEGDI